MSWQAIARANAKQSKIDNLIQYVLHKLLWLCHNSCNKRLTVYGIHMCINMQISVHLLTCTESLTKQPHTNV